MTIPLSAPEQTAAARQFADHWKTRPGSEHRECHPFWMGLLRVLGVENPEQGFIEFEATARLDTEHGFIDAYIPSTHVLIEQKSRTRDLRAPIRQSDGTLLTPFQQARRYASDLPYSRRPRWIVTCNFAEFHVYDMENPNAEPEVIRLADLPDEWYRLQFLVNAASDRVAREMEVSIEAGRIVGRIYDALLAQYGDPTPEVLHWLNVLCVRLVFCLYAEDAGIFANNQFHDYLAPLPPEDVRRALLDLFEVLNTPEEKRSRYLKPALAAFPYTNGGLFAGPVEIPQFTPGLKEALLQKASLDFDWADISPTIFGAVFESTLNPDTRRSGGMHYTSLENIHKVIDPLFLDALRAELDSALALPVPKQRDAALLAYQQKLASLAFLDPACGSGNFLTETYLSLRRLENQAIAARLKGQGVLGVVENPIRVSIHQFHGIEINDFAVSVAKTALWIAESQMLAETLQIVSLPLQFLPLESYDGILEANALRLDWSSLAPRFDYIIGNPPFVGKSFQSPEQKADMALVFDGVKNYGNLDFVASWFKKAADLMLGTSTRVAFVATNSLCQGIAVPPLWNHLLAQGFHIDFAHKTFPWDNQTTSGKAHVHVIIVGFSHAPSTAPRLLFEADRPVHADNINPYLLSGPNIIVVDQPAPFADTLPTSVGSFATDGGNLILDAEEKDELLAHEPAAAPLVRPYLSPEDFINNVPRYCLWLKNASPNLLKDLPLVRERIEGVRRFRLASKKAQTRKRADTPTLFAEDRQPSSDYLLIPRVSSENRRYVPIGFIPAEVIAGDTIILPNATLYHFGILTSNVHMAWMRVLCGRMKSDYRYSPSLVYNTFPWPDLRASASPREKIETTARAILDARAAHPDCSLKTLYDPLLMPPDLLAAHRANDRAVMSAYGFDLKMAESDCVAALFKLYEALAK